MAVLTTQPFFGHVLGRFERACNLADAQRRIIVVTLPEVGNGPFSVVVGERDWFGSLSLQQSVSATHHHLTMGAWKVDLSAAQIWEPRLSDPPQPFYLNSAITRILKPYTNWPHGPEVNATLFNRLAQAATQLNRAIRAAATKKIVSAAGQLAGLGFGLTPAGDDYLVGVMAALWLAGRREWLGEIAQIAAPRTTTLSAAFLRAAAQGEFMEPWHSLAQTLYTEEPAAVRQAVAQVAQLGASSGVDALAGFTATLNALGSIEMP